MKNNPKNSPLPYWFITLPPCTGCLILLQWLLRMRTCLIIPTLCFLQLDYVSTVVIIRIIKRTFFPDQCWSGKKWGTKVFNWLEVHFCRTTSYKIHTLRALIWKDRGTKVFNWSQVYFYRSNFLQNPYFRNINIFEFNLLSNFVFLHNLT